METRNFYFYIAAFIGMMIGNVLLLQTAFNNIPAIAGWNFYNVLALFATFRITRGIFGCFIGANLSNLFQTIRKGNLDLFLIKPASAWFMLNLQIVDLARIVDIGCGVGLLIYTLFFIHWSVLNLFLYLCFILLALILLSCTNVLISMTSFLNVRETMLSFVEKLQRATTRFPLRFAGDTVEFIFTWLLPLMFLTTIPVEVLEGRINLVYAFASAFILCAFYIWLTQFCWRKALLSYSSASS